MAKKFIINNNRIILGDVNFHSELLTDNTQTVGGGHWHYDHVKDRIYLFGLSTDFGHVTKQQIQNCYSYALEGRTLFYSPSLNLEEALRTAEQVHFITSNTQTT